MGNRIAQSLLKRGIFEDRIEFKDPDFGFDCVAIPDIRIPELGIIADLKSAGDCSRWAFRKSLYFLKYHWQGWFYLRAANVKWPGQYKTFLIIAQETKPPYGIMIYKLSDKTLMDAQVQIMPLLELFKKCLDSGDWPQYPQEIIEI